MPTIDELLELLRTASPGEAKRLRAKLRKMGHRGGLHPSASPSRPVTASRPPTASPASPSSPPRRSRRSRRAATASPTPASPEKELRFHIKPGTGDPTPLPPPGSRTPPFRPHPLQRRLDAARRRVPANHELCYGPGYGFYVVRLPSRERDYAPGLTPEQALANFLHRRKE